MRCRFIFIALAAVLTSACTSGPPAAPADARDLHSFARPEEARVTHVALDLRVDFEARRLTGTATLSLERAGGAGAVVLDTRDLTIEQIADRSGRPLRYELGPGEATLGRPLRVDLPSGVTDIVIAYHTSPEAAALQWLSPEQTAGKRQPYLFSQGEPILTRTWIPTQDSPVIRQTYSATIAVPAALRAVMSAGPYGGMENPRLTFATPTILAGDRSLTSLIAHELAHSWSGNLVTNATWRDFWLNEGLTTYVEHRIVEALYGRQQAVMLQALGRQQLLDELARLEPADTVLHVDLAGRDPDAGFTTVPYEKGSAFAHLLEARAGRGRFDAFLQGYFDRHAFGSITTAGFAEEVRANLFRGDRALEEQVRMDEWLYRPGLPSNAPVPESAALAEVARQAARFAEGALARALDTKGWTTPQWQRFLDALPPGLAPRRLSDLDRTFTFTRSGNSEILFAWLRIAIRNRYEPALPALEAFLTSQGRRKSLRPLYEDLMTSDWGRAEAKRIYAKARPTYHSVAATTLDAIVR